MQTYSRRTFHIRDQRVLENFIIEKIQIKSLIRIAVKIFEQSKKKPSITLIKVASTALEPFTLQPPSHLHGWTAATEAQSNLLPFRNWFLPKSPRPLLVVYTVHVLTNQKASRCVSTNRKREPTRAGSCRPAGDQYVVLVPVYGWGSPLRMTHPANCRVCF